LDPLPCAVYGIWHQFSVDYSRNYFTGFPLFSKKKNPGVCREFSSPMLEFLGAFSHSSQPKYIKYETFITDVHHSFLCNTN